MGEWVKVSWNTWYYFNPSLFKEQVMKNLIEELDNQFEIMHGSAHLLLDSIMQIYELCEKEAEFGRVRTDRVQAIITNALARVSKGMETKPTTK
jgi:hypothetical protein